MFKRAYGIYRERGYRTRLLAAAYRHRLHWTELVGGDIVMTMTHAWQARFNESGIDPVPRIDEPVDPAIIDELCARVPDFRRAYEPDGLAPAEFEGFGATARTLRSFIAGYHDLHRDRARRRPAQPGRPLTDSIAPVLPVEATADEPVPAVHSHRAALVLLALLAVIWGVHWVIVKVGLGYVPPITYAASRVAIALVLMTVVLRVQGRLRLPDRSNLSIILSIGLLQVAAGVVLQNLALQVVDAGRSAVLVYTMPLWVAVILLLAFRIRPTRSELAGLVLGIVGLGFLLNPSSIDWSKPGELAGAAGLLLNAILWAAVTIHIRRHHWTQSPLDLQPWQLLAALIPLTVLAIGVEHGEGIRWEPASLLFLAVQRRARHGVRRVGDAGDHPVARSAGVGDGLPRDPGRRAPLGLARPRGDAGAGRRARLRPRAGGRRGHLGGLAKRSSRGDCRSRQGRAVAAFAEDRLAARRVRLGLVFGLVATMLAPAGVSAADPATRSPRPVARPPRPPASSPRDACSSGSSPGPRRRHGAWRSRRPGRRRPASRVRPAARTSVAPELRARPRGRPDRPPGRRSRSPGSTPSPASTSPSPTA